MCQRQCFHLSTQEGEEGSLHVLTVDWANRWKAKSNACEEEVRYSNPIKFMRPNLYNSFDCGCMSSRAGKAQSCQAGQQRHCMRHICDNSSASASSGIRILVTRLGNAPPSPPFVGNHKQKLNVQCSRLYWSPLQYQVSAV